MRVPIHERVTLNNSLFILSLEIGPLFQRSTSTLQIDNTFLKIKKYYGYKELNFSIIFIFIYILP